ERRKSLRPRAPPGRGPVRPLHEALRGPRPEDRVRADRDRSARARAVPRSHAGADPRRARDLRPRRALRGSRAGAERWRTGLRPLRQRRTLMQLSIRGVSKTYSSGVRALKDVTLTIPAGMYGLLGPNGSGKSTLMRTLATLQEPDEGCIHLGDIDVRTQKDE